VLTVPAFLPPMIGETGVKTKVYMARLAAESVPPDIALGYAKHVREIALRRRIAEISIQMAPDAATDAAQLAAEAIDALDTIVASSASWALPAASMAQVMARSVDKVAKAYPTTAESSASRPAARSRSQDGWPAAGDVAGARWSAGYG
jgi:replicative DNA helicase